MTEDNAARAYRDVSTCPDCGSADLRVFYTERHACTVGTFDGESWPAHGDDEVVELDADSFSFRYMACDAEECTPVLRTRPVP